jgi:hypothetical protein
MDMLRECKTKNSIINCKNYNGINKEKDEDPNDGETYLKRT